MHKFAKATIAIIMMSMCGDSVAASVARRRIVGLMASPAPIISSATNPESANPKPEPTDSTPPVNNENTAV
jgi:hypothetical protein